MAQELTWFSMRASAPRRGEIVIYDEIGKNWWDDSGMSAQRFHAELRKLGDVDDIDLFVNSPGGNMMDGNTIYNLLRAHPAKVTGTVHGYAASAASLILMACDTIKMPQNTMLMIHNPATRAVGDANDLRKQAETLDLFKKGAVTAYAKKSGLPESEVSTMMDRTTWMTAAMAKSLGFADEVVDEVQVTNSFDWGRFNLPAPPVLSVSGSPGAQSPAQPPVVPQPVMSSFQEVHPMSIQNTGLPATPPSALVPPAMQAPANMVSMTKEQLQAMIQEAVAQGQAPAMQELMKSKIESTRREFANMVSAGKLTPAQSRMFGSLAEAVMSVPSQFTFSLKDDGSDTQNGTAVDVLFALAGSMKSHGLLQEQVATADNQPGAQSQASGVMSNPVGTYEQLAATFTASKDLIPEASEKLPEAWFCDQFIRNVVMAADPKLSYRDAALKVEKCDTYKAKLKQFLKS